MKRVMKGQQPTLYIAWCSSVRGTQDEDYRCLPAAEKEALLSALVAEQGSLCAYTMRRISPDRSHVEHVKPQSRCRADQQGTDLTYTNIIACFPREGMKSECRYGAQAKDDWWSDDPNEFVSPLDQHCEDRFLYSMDGQVTPKRAHSGAENTIDVLKLNHPSLVEDRKRVIEEFVYGANGSSPLRKQQAEAAKQTICTRTGQGPLAEFCIAIRDGLDEHVKQLDKQARKKAMARGGIRGRR